MAAPRADKATPADEAEVVAPRARKAAAPSGKATVASPSTEPAASTKPAAGTKTEAGTKPVTRTKKAPEPAPKVESRLIVTQVRSAIGTKPKHRGTLRALGLGRIGQSNDLPDRPEIRGMIARVPHLVTVSEEQTV